MLKKISRAAQVTVGCVSALIALNATQAMARSVFVYSGGFGSCIWFGHTSELKARKKMDAVTDQALQLSGQKPIEIRTCYAVGKSTIYVSAPELDLENEVMSIDQFHSTVRRAAELAGDRAPIYMWGQSHGGWTVMDLVAREDGLNYRVLTTVDPISVLDCGPIRFSGGVITGSAPGCRRSPRDLEPVGPLIRSRVKLWSNFYENEFSLLHSGPIKSASENILRVLHASWWSPMGAHAAIEVDDVTWGFVSERMINDLKLQVQ